MTRINTNVASLTAQKTLARSNAALHQALTRLSTGLRINSGKDDPAGLIASEMLRSTIVSTNKAISNSERANQIIATADAALAQINSLLNDIRGLVTEAANTGAMSADQIAANQLQIDSSLEAINRIAATTSFQGRKLLDGSMDFIHTANSVSSVVDVEIHQANLGATGSITVDVDISAAATQASIVGANGTQQASAVLRFRAGAQVSVGGGAIRINAADLGDAEEGVTITFTSGAATAVAYDPDAKTLNITFQAGVTKVADIVTAINSNLDEFEAETVTTGTLTAADDGKNATTGYDAITITAASEGPSYNGVRISVVTQNGIGSPQARYYSDTKNLVITIDDSTDTTLAAIASAIDSLSEFSATASANGDGVVNGSTADAKAIANTGISGYLNTAFSSASNATATLQFAPSASLTFASGAVIDIKASAIDSTYNNVNISFVADSTAVGSEYAEWDEQAKTLKIHINNSAATTAANVVNAINALDGWDAYVVTAGAVDGSGSDASLTATTAQDQIIIKALIPGADYNGIQVQMQTASGIGSSPTASYDASSKTLTITIDDSQATDLSAIDAAIDQLTEFSASHREYGATRIRGSSADVNATANTGSTGGNTLLDDLVFELRGPKGTEVFTFEEGTSVNDVVEAINLVSDATGVTASQSHGLLTLQSTDYGSDAFIEVNVISEGSDGTFERALSATRTTGTDIQATINGVTANASGNTMSINTSMLDLTITVADGSSTDFEFTISGGGALFQLGPDVVTTQQARLGLPSVNTATLRGKSGRLYQLGSGQSAALDTNPRLAARIIEEVITKVSSLRGRLGAFQKSTLETNINALKDTVEKLTEAESTIRDADFAAETAALTRAQILVQAGTSVLAIANSQPQNVLALLR